MKNLPSLVKKILTFNEPDPSKWNEWLEKKELYPTSTSETMMKFVNRIQTMKSNHEKILIAGDYDCDGIMATTIMMNGLKRYGIDCGFYIPNRLKEGYGLHESTIQMASSKGYTAIITVDNGVKANNALDFARTLGMKTIVTDHHTIDEKVHCDVLVHPDLLEDCFQYLCGAGIAYECIRALGVDTDFDLMCAAVASIGDVMIVKNQTRAIIQKGIEKLNATKQIHFFSLCNDPILNETSISFQIVPKLNAIGRLSDLANVNNVVRYFLCQDEKSIHDFALQIDGLNNKRKELSTSMVEDAMKQCHEDKDIYLICDRTYHEGILGLASGSLCAKLNKPVIIMTNNNHSYKASMRSPNGFDCMEFLSKYPNFETFGGHAQASGFSIAEESFLDFKNYIEENIHYYEWKIEPKKTISVNEMEINLESIQSLDCLRPFGMGFELPVFEIVNPKIRSIFDLKMGMHRKYTLESGLICMHFSQSEMDRQKKSVPISSIEGKTSLSYYQNRQSVNFIIDEIKYSDYFQ
ncbi:MAG: DHH family phosphoesterase [Holdemanella sp.]|nr:DHH family phosphoesterase [Holdemanella sp.]